MWSRGRPTKEDLEDGWKTRQNRQTYAARNRSLPVPKMWSYFPRGSKQKEDLTRSSFQAYTVKNAQLFFISFVSVTTPKKAQGPS